MSSIETEWRNYLLENNIIDGPVELKKREGVLSLLRSLLPSFIQHCVKENNTRRADYECHLVPFGSFGLGGHIAGGDIDLVLLAPIPVRRRDFSEFFSRLLKKQPIVCEVEVISRANVPIIKCVVDSIPIDISFVRLQMASVPADIDLLDDSFLQGLESSCLASMDGPRVNQFILRHIHPKDMPVFRLALQCIKHWANQRCLYGKPMGYLNGGAWTLLLVKTYLLQQSHITQLNKTRSQPGYSSHDLISSSPSPSSSSSSTSSPYRSFPTSTTSSAAYMSPSPASSNVSELSEPSDSTPISLTMAKSSSSRPQSITFISLLESFFSTWSTWPWPDPVIVTESTPTALNPSSDKNENLKNSLLPIATPCYPVTSAAPFVTKSTLTVIVSELQRVHQLLQCNNFTHAKDKMDMIFRPTRIIKEYKHFIKVMVSCESLKSHTIWSRRMPAHLPRLVELLESLDEIFVARPFTTTYKALIPYQTQQEKILLRIGQLMNPSSLVQPLQPGELYTNSFLLGLEFYEHYKRDNKVIDLSEIIHMYHGELDGKMNSKDVDVFIHLSAIKRREVAALIL